MRRETARLMFAKMTGASQVSFVEIFQRYCIKNGVRA
jgi:hypothetical protein